MKEIVNIPFLGANDDECVLIKWNFSSGDNVTEKEVICLIETTKTVLDVESEFEGYIYPLAEVGDNLMVGDALAIISSEILEAHEIETTRDNQRSIKPRFDTVSEAPLTKKAEILLNRHQLRIEQLREFTGNESQIKESDVLRFIESKSLLNKQLGFNGYQQRIGIIGGVNGGGALIVIDSLMRNNNQKAVCIFEQNSQVHGQRILDVPIVGDISKLKTFFNDNKLDAVIIAFNRDLDEREKLYIQLKSENIPFCNIIDPTVEIRSDVSLGEGNIILAKSYIGACCQIGNNNFISANVSLEHGNVLGNHCAFGPGIFSSGNVIVGNNVRFAAGIFMEPNITIGNNVIISSGAVVRDNIPENSILKVSYSHKLSKNKSKD